MLPVDQQLELQASPLKVGRASDAKDHAYTHADAHANIHADADAHAQSLQFSYRSLTLRKLCILDQHCRS